MEKTMKNLLTDKSLYLALRRLEKKLTECAGTFDWRKDEDFLLTVSEELQDYNCNTCAPLYLSCDSVGVLLQFGNSTTPFVLSTQGKKLRLDPVLVFSSPVGCDTPDPFPQDPHDA